MQKGYTAHTNGNPEPFLVGSFQDSEQTHLKGLEWEQAVLGSLLEDPSLIEGSELTPADFINTEHREIFRAITGLYREGVVPDAISIWDQCGKKEGLLDYLHGLKANAVPSNLPYYAGKLRELSHRRRQLGIAQELVSALREGNKEKVTILKKELLEVVEETPEPGFNLDFLSLCPDDLVDKGQTYLFEGFLPKQAVILISGRFSSGKSLLSLALAKKILNQGEPVVYVDMDMPIQVVNSRLDQSGLKAKLGNGFYYLHRSKVSMKIGDKGWKRFMDHMKRQGHHFIILDNLKDLIPPGVNVNLDVDMIPIMDEIKRLRDYGHTVLLLHHWGWDGSQEKPFKNNMSIGDGVDAGFTLKNENGTLTLTYFKDRIPVRQMLAFRLTDDFELLETETPDQAKLNEEMELIYETIERLSRDGEEVTQGDVVTALRGQLGYHRIRELLKKGEGKLWDATHGRGKTLLYKARPKTSKLQTIYKERSFEVLKNTPTGDRFKDIYPPEGHSETCDCNRCASFYEELLEGIGPWEGEEPG